MLSNYHAVKRQLIARFGKDVFVAHKTHVSDYLRRVSSFALPQTHRGVSQLLHAKEGLLLLFEYSSLKDVLALSETCTLVHTLLSSEPMYVCVLVRMHACMHVCVYVCLCLSVCVCVCVLSLIHI